MQDRLTEVRNVPNKYYTRKLVCSLYAIGGHRGIGQYPPRVRDGSPKGRDYRLDSRQPDLPKQGTPILCVDKGLFWRAIDGGREGEGG